MDSVRSILLTLACLVVFGFSALYAHEIRPAYLQLKQVSAQSYDMLWKVPMLNGAIPKINPSFNEQIDLILQDEQLTPDALIRRYQATLGAQDQINGETIQFPLLENTLIDVLVYVETLDGATYSQMARPDQPYVTIPEEPNRIEVIKTYSFLGVEHILLGIDHLLFVACLLLLISQLSTLIKAITAFTLSHSITLICATLGWVNVPGPPVEAIIALSIVFLAREYIMTNRGETSITARYPWVVAFIFGLLHGFGFAGALGDIGLPQTEVPMALLFFNIGVELGQLIFVAVLGGLLYLMLKILPKYLAKVKLGGAYAIGGMGMYWIIERILGF